MRIHHNYYYSGVSHLYNKIILKITTLALNLIQILVDNKEKQLNYEHFQLG